MGDLLGHDPEELAEHLSGQGSATDRLDLLEEPRGTNLLAARRSIESVDENIAIE